MSPVVKLSAVIKPVVVKLFASISLSTVRSLTICTSLFGIKISPVPVARSSKSAFDVVVVM